MSDYKKPRTNLNNFLPDQLKSALLQNLNENLFNRYLTKEEFEHTVGLIGDPDSTSAYKQISEPTAYRQQEQLQPVVSATVGTDNQYLSFQDFMERLSRLDVNLDEYDQWGRALQFNLVPPIDIDKIINYRNYYWNSTDNTEIPDYITIKNQENWAYARSFEFKKAVVNLQPSYNIKYVDENTVSVQGNVISSFSQNDQVLITNGAQYYTNTINTLMLNPITGITNITLSDPIEDNTVTTMYSLIVGINSINAANNQFILNGDWSGLFTEGYVFLAPNQLSNSNTLFSVKSVEYQDNTVDKTFITTNESIPLLASWTKLSLYPMISLVQEEYNSLIGNNNISYNYPWNNKFLGNIIWDRELVLLQSDTGYSVLGDHGIHDDNEDFVSSFIRPGDYIVINGGPVTGKYQIISVQNNFIGIDSSVRLFTKDSLSYTIERETYYDYFLSDTPPLNPSTFSYWSNSVNDSLYQWNGSIWVEVVRNISLLVNATHQRYKLSLVQTDPWSTSNKWIHKNQITSYSGKTRAQMPIIEFDSYLELSSTTKATYNWKYRKLKSDVYSDTENEPNLFEISNIKLINGDEFVFSQNNVISLNEKYGNLTDILTKGYVIKFSGFTQNNGIYEVDHSEYIQRNNIGNDISRFNTNVYLTKTVDTNDLPINAIISPNTTSMGDAWLGYDTHWIFYGLKDVIPSSISPDINPALNVFVKSYHDDINLFETNVGLSWQSYSYDNDGNVGVTIPFDSSLHDLVLYDDYQEGDIRIYINGIRQYGNFQDIESDINSNFIGAIKFDNTVVINNNDLIRVELGEYSLADVGKRAISIPSNINIVDSNLPYDLINITSIRKLEQDKQTQNEYPFFTIYDVHGEAKDIATRIFTYTEDSSYPLNQFILRRIVYDADTQDYGFTQELSDADTGELYSYKNFSQPNNPLQTIWQRGLNNEQFQPTKLSDGSWDIPNNWFYNINHELQNTLNYSDIYSHFASIINSQTVPGTIQSNATNNFYVDDNINYGLGGTIKEHNNGLDLLVSSILVNNVNPLLLIQFGHDRYEGLLYYAKEELLDNLDKYLIDGSYQNISDVSSNLTSLIIDSIETNNKFDTWFGDSTTYADGIGVKNWIATLPYLKLAKKTQPYVIKDSVLDIYEVVCHDGHREQIVVQSNIVQKINNILKNNGAITSQITSDNDPFPAVTSSGSIVIRYNTTTSKTRIYRLSATSVWEEIIYKDIISNTILQIETELYNNCPNFDDTIYDFSKIVTNDRYQSLLNTQFSNFAKTKNIQTPLINTYYKSNNPFTWNYEFTIIQRSPIDGNVSYDTAVDYRSLYTKYYNTPYPHLEPWKLQGYIQKPDWWDTEYKNTTASRVWKKVMWVNIVSGKVPRGELLPNNTISNGRTHQIQTYLYIPVNMDSTNTLDGYLPDSLLPPYWDSSNTTNPNIGTFYDAKLNESIISPNIDYTFGDGNPNEWSWQVSSQRLYDNLTLAFKIDPLNFTSITFNGNNVSKINCLDVDTQSSKVFSHANTIFHGEVVDDEVFKSDGLNQWYINYNRYYGYDGDASQFQELWKNWTINLAYMLGSYTDISSFSISNSSFEMTEKDYGISVKKTVGFVDMWMDTLKATLLSVPSKYSTLRDNGIGWTVQFNTTSPVNNNIVLYPKENFDFRSVKNSNIFEIYAYDIYNAGIVLPIVYRIVNYGQQLLPTTITNLANTNYSASFVLEDTTINVIINGKNVRTVDDFITNLNSQLDGHATAYLSNGDLVIQTATPGVFDINDQGLFVSLYNTFLGISDVIETDYTFDKSFDINGNLTNLFLEGTSFTIEDSTQFNGTYTIKSVYYDLSNSITKIFVNEDISITSDIIDGIIRPTNRRTLPDTWVDGTEVYLSTMGTLPSPLNEFRQYYVSKIDDYKFNLSLVKDGAPISALTQSTSQQFVGRIRFTFKANNGDVTGYTWRQHYSDTRQTLSYAQPVYISGIQQMIDFVDGYSDYLEFLGFDSKTTDIPNTLNGRQVSWQSEVENFIDELYSARTISQNNDISFGVTVDLDNNRFVYKDNSVSLAKNSRVIFSVSSGGKLPDPISNPLKEYIPYYAIPSNDGLGFQISYTLSDATKGVFIELENIGSGDISFGLYNSGSIFPQFSINPYENSLKVSHPQGILSNVITNDRMDILTNQKIYDTNGNQISAKNIFVLREDESSQVFLTDATKNNNITSKSPTLIGGMHVFLDSYEHILIFNDRTISNDLIYDPFLGIRTPRFFVEFDRQTNYTLRPNVGGFFVYNDSLVQNFESSVEDLRYMNDAYNALESKPLIKYLRTTLGYNGRQSYLQNLNINQKSDFIFWRGMVKNKGTNLSINAYTNQVIFNNADLDEFWAYKLAEFGDSKQKNYPELKLTRADSIKTETRFEFVNPEENVSDPTFTAVALTDQTRWWNQPDVINDMAPSQAFYISADVKAILTDQQSNIISINGMYILELETPTDGIILTYVDANGLTQQLINGIDYVKLNNYIIRFTTDYDPRTINHLSVNMVTYNYYAHNPAVFVDKIDGIILDQVSIWNPSENQHYQEAFSAVDFIENVDPAKYNIDYIGDNSVDVWAENHIDKVWLDSSAMYYLPYNDDTIMTDINDRIHYWGKLADNGQVSVYQWTKTPYLPTDYVANTNNNGTPLTYLYQNNGTQDSPIWIKLSVNRESFNIATINQNTTTQLDGIVEIYRNGKYELDLNLSDYSLYVYAYGELVPNQANKPSVNDRIVIQSKLPVPTQDQLNNLIYKIDTPYTIVTTISPTNGGSINEYYYWISGRTDVISSVTNYTTTAYQLQLNLINNPDPYMFPLNLRYNDDGYGVNFGNVFDGTPYNLPPRYSQLIIKGLKGLVGEENRYALRFINDFTLRDMLPYNGNLYNYSNINSVKTPLALKNKHIEWKLFREKQPQKVDQYLWDKLISALVGYNVKNNVIDTSTTIPSLNRILFDQLYDVGSRYGLGDDQILVDPAIGLATIQSILTDPTQVFINIDIISFLESNLFDTVNDIVSSMYAIYDSFDASNINYIFFSVLNDAIALKKESPDFFKTSWVALDISQNVINAPQVIQNLSGNIIPGGLCDVDTNIVVPTQPPLPSPSPTPSITPSLSPSISISITPSFTPTLTNTPTITFTPTASITPTVTFTPTASITPTVTFTPTASITPTQTATISFTPTPTVSPTISPVGNTCYDDIVTFANPLVYFKLDDINTGVARDFTGSGRDGFYQGNVVLGDPGLFNTSVRSIAFPNDFSDNNFIYNDYGSYLNMPYDFTFEIQANADATQQQALIPSLVYLAYNPSALQPQFQLYIDVDTGKYAFQISTTDMPQATLLSNTIADGTPHVITCRRMSDKIYIFIDGVEEVSMPVTGANNTTTTNGIMLGGAPYQVPNVYNYVGGMDCFSLYNYALADEDIASRYECIAGIVISPSVTPTPTPTPTPSITPTVSPSLTPSISITRSPTPSPTRTPSPSQSPTPAPSVTPSTSVTIVPPSPSSIQFVIQDEGDGQGGTNCVAACIIQNGPGVTHYNWSVQSTDPFFGSLSGSQNVDPSGQTTFNLGGGPGDCPADVSSATLTVQACNASGCSAGTTVPNSA